MKKALLFGVAIILVVFALQWIPVKKNISSEKPGISFERNYKVPENISKILSNSCYDCHSNNTRYPQYSKIQPAAWFLQKHIKDGRRELNFDDFNNYSNRRKKAKIRSVVSQIEKDEMPLRSYELMHPEAKLSKEEKKLVLDFFKSIEIQQKWPCNFNV